MHAYVRISVPWYIASVTLCLLSYDKQLNVELLCVINFEGVESGTRVESVKVKHGLFPKFHCFQGTQRRCQCWRRHLRRWNSLRSSSILQGSQAFEVMGTHRSMACQTYMDIKIVAIGVCLASQMCGMKSSIWWLQDNNREKDLSHWFLLFGVWYRGSGMFVAMLTWSQTPIRWFCGLMVKP
jgi:hypothetical protein